MKIKGKSERENISSYKRPSFKLGKIIKEARKKAKLSLDELAFSVGVSKEWLRLLENGSVKEAGVSKIIKIFYTLGLNIEELNKTFIPDMEKTVLKKVQEMDSSELKALFMFQIRESINRKK